MGSVRMAVLGRSREGEWPVATWGTVVELAARLPGVEESTSYRTPALKVRGRLFARLREDGESVVVFADDTEREALVQQDPDTFFTTPHYQGHPIVLIRLARVDPTQLEELLVESWRRKAPPTVLRDFAGRPESRPADGKPGDEGR
jgi:hypothetical protein